MSAMIPSPRVLLGPGPSCVTAGVLESLARAPIGYLDPELFELLNRLRGNLRTLFGTSNGFTIPLTGTGMAGMESCLVNLLEPGDRVVVGVAGFFGGRIVEICQRLGAEVSVVEAEWGRPLDPAAFNKALHEAAPVKLAACVHAETSTGVRQPLRELVRLAHEQGALFLADAVTSLGGIPVDIDDVGVDVCYSATQKCVGAPPGISPITVNETALLRRRTRQAKMPNWYLDWRLLGDYYDGAHAYHHTVPVNLLFALDAALLEIMFEGVETRYLRHQAVSDTLMSGLAELGILPFAEEGYRLPTLNAVYIPPGIDDEAAVRRRLLTEYGIEIGGGLGQLKGRIWRIGTMGASATHRNAALLVAALRDVLGRT